MRTLGWIGLASALFLCVACGGEDTNDAEPGDSDRDDAGGSSSGDVVGSSSGGSGGSWSSSSSSSGGGDVVTAECPPDARPADRACVLHERFGVFVSASLGNDDSGDGSRARPFKSVARGMVTAKADRRRLYVCAESYAEGLVIEQDVDVYGDLSCANGVWQSANQRAVLNAPASPAARATNVESATRVEGIELVAPAAGPGESSIGLFVENSSGLRWTEGKIVAGPGGAGADGVTPAAYVLQGGVPARGAGSTRCDRDDGYLCPTPATAAVGGTCVAGAVTLSTYSGGYGGGAGIGHRESTGTPPALSYRVKRIFGANGGEVATGQHARGCSLTYPADLYASPWIAVAEAGTVGAVGADGANATSNVMLSMAGYVPSNGTAGANGGSGLGGGGGCGSLPTSLPFLVGVGQSPIGTFSGDAGGAGGAGGCPGRAGSAGQGGGASIAVLTNVSFLIERSALVANPGGVGGAGSLGSAPSAGAEGGPGGRAGAAGGAGGAAGYAGHGGSGPSFGIAWTGAAVPITDAATLITVSPAAGQPERSGNGKTIPAAPAGLAEKIYAF